MIFFSALRIQVYSQESTHTNSIAETWHIISSPLLSNVLYLQHCHILVNVALAGRRNACTPMDVHNQASTQICVQIHGHAVVLFRQGSFYSKCCLIPGKSLRLPMSCSCYYLNYISHYVYGKNTSCYCKMIKEEMISQVIIL